MEDQLNTETNYSLYYILAIVFLSLTSWVYYGTVASVIFGAFLGLILAAFFVNVLVKDRH